MWLLVVACIGLVAGNGLFVSWLLNDFHGLAAVMSDRLAMAFIVDAMITLAVLSVHFAKQPVQRVRWPWFIVLSLIGGLCFGLPFYWWLNRSRPGTNASAA